MDQPHAETDARPGGANLIVKRSLDGHVFPNRDVYLNMSNAKRILNSLRPFSGYNCELICSVKRGFKVESYDINNEGGASHPATFKAAVALAAIEGERSLAEIANQYGVTPELVQEWKKTLISHAGNAFVETSWQKAPSKEISLNELAIAIAENSTQGFAMMDEHGYCIYANRTWLQMTGYTAEEIGSAVLHDLVHHHYPDGRPYPMAECPIDRALPTNFKVRAHEDLFFRKDGTTFSVMCAASPIFRNGRPVATVIEIRDITEKKRIDEELRRVSARQAFQLKLADTLRALTEPQEIMVAATRLVGEHLRTGRAGYADVDKTGNLASVKRDWTNSVVSSLAGESRPLDETFGTAIIDELRRGRTLRLDDVAENPLSAPYAAGYAGVGARSLVTVPLLEQGRLTALLYVHEASPRKWTDDEVILVEDVARRTWEALKRARVEESLRDETRILELLNQTGQVVASTLDMQTLLQSITDTATQISGAQFGAFFYSGKNEQGDAMMLYTLSGAPREAFDKFGQPRATPLFAATFHGQTIRSDDVTKDALYGQWTLHHGMPPGHLPVRSYLAVPVISRSGEAIGGLFFGHLEKGIFSERTERIILGVAAQAAIAVDNARLYEESLKAAKERESLLTSERAARAEAERLSQMKDEFLAMLAHELRNPLAPIAAAADLLSLLYADEPRVKQSGDIISRQVSHMTRLVDDLLDVSRVTRGLVMLQHKLVDFRDVVSGALVQTRTLFEQKRHSVTVQMPDEPVYVNGDETRLVQTVANILNNAAKYTREAGLVDVTLKAAGEHLQLHIKDNGTGIAPELLPDVFELFTQGTRTLARSQGGLGLGLALVKKLVQLHGGDVTAHSAGIGQGSEFMISLPLASMGAEEPHTKNRLDATEVTSQSRTQSFALRLTVIDDNVDAADTLATLLRAQGHQVGVHHSAQAALHAAATEVPQVFLVDIGLPDMNGYNLARQLRALPQMAGSTLVAVTGYGQAQDREQAKAAGFDYHLVKPVNIHALTELLSRVAQPTTTQ